MGAEPKVTTSRAPEPPKRPKYGVFGARSGVEVNLEGVFLVPVLQSEKQKIEIKMKKPVLNAFSVIIKYNYIIMYSPGVCKSLVFLLIRFLFIDRIHMFL